MIRASFNIGYYSKALGQSGILSYHPQQVDSVGDLLQDLRTKQTIKNLFNWSDERHVTPSSMTIFITCKHHSFTVRMINVREYRKFWEKKYKSVWNTKHS